MNEPPIDINDPAVVTELLAEAAEILCANKYRSGSSVRLPARGRLLVTGDLHDNPVHLRKIIRLAGLDASPDHHLVVHEIIHGEHLLNGMDFSYRMLCRVADLVRRYPGQVHPLLANHELAQMLGIGVSKGAGNSVELFDDALAYTYGDAWEEVSSAIGGFIRAMPIALRSESGVFCAHSLPSARAMKTFDLDLLERDLTDDDYAPPTGSAYQLVWGREHTDEQIAHLCEHWKVQLFCLGHRYVETGSELVHPNVLVLNSDHERGSAVALDLAETPDGEKALMMVTPLSSIGDAEESAA